MSAALSAASRQWGSLSRWSLPTFIPSCPIHADCFRNKFIARYSGSRKETVSLHAYLKLFHVEHGICSKTGNCWGKLGMFSSWISETLDLVFVCVALHFFPSLKESVVSQVQVQLACLKKSILEQRPLSLSFENPWPGKNFRWGKQAHCSYGLIWWMEISFIITKGLCCRSQGAHLTLPKSSFWGPHPPLSFSS